MNNAFLYELTRRLKEKAVQAEMSEPNRIDIYLRGEKTLYVTAQNTVMLLPDAGKSDEAGDLYHEVAQTADEVWAYVEAVQTAPILQAKDLSEEFHLLADFGGAVLAGRERKCDLGYQFVTWVWDYGRTSVIHGHYYEQDYQGAKQDFAIRSGLISKTQLFTPEEMTELYRATDHLLEDDPVLEQNQLQALQDARTKIEYTVPDLSTRLEQGQHPNHTMEL